MSMAWLLSHVDSWSSSTRLATQQAEMAASQTGSLLLILGAASTCFSAPATSPETGNALQLQVPRALSKSPGLQTLYAISETFLFYFEVFGVAQTLLETYAVARDLDTKRREKSKEDAVDIVQPHLQEIRDELNQVLQLAQSVKQKVRRSSVNFCDRLVGERRLQARKRRGAISLKPLQPVWNVWYYINVALAVVAFYGDAVAIFDPNNKDVDSVQPVEELLDEIEETFQNVMLTFQEMGLTEALNCTRPVVKRSVNGPPLTTPYLALWEMLNIGLTIFGAYADYLSLSPEDPDPMEAVAKKLEEFKNKLAAFNDDFYNNLMERAVPSNCEEQAKRRARSIASFKVLSPMSKAISIFQNWNEIRAFLERWFFIWEYANIPFVLYAFVADSRTAYLYSRQEEDAIDNVTGQIGDIKELLDSLQENLKFLSSACS